MNRFRFTQVAGAVAWVLAVMMPQLATAKQTPPAPVDPTPFVIPANSAFYACSFDLQVEYDGKGGTIDLPGGRFATVSISPGLTVTLTNLEADPPMSVTLPIPGTMKTYTDTSGNYVTIADGRNLLGDPTTGLVLAVGHFKYVFDPEGNLVTPLNGTGKLLPVCPMLE